MNSNVCYTADEEVTIQLPIYMNARMNEWSVRVQLTHVYTRPKVSEDRLHAVKKYFGRVSNY